MRRVVEKFVKEVETQLAERKVTLELSEAARAWLAQKGYDPLFGARPLARVLQTSLKDPLADDLLFGRLVKGGHVRVDCAEEALVFDVEGNA
jgi:ATP-dependent Clp protease ATP-binding subunit ClpA